MNKGLFTSNTDLWGTPQKLFDELNLQWCFDLDVCAIPENAKCEKFFTPEQDGLKQDWTGVCWMNPPYGREIGKWIKKAYNEAQKGAIVVALLPARTDTKWFHNWIYQKDSVQVDFIKGRLKFGDSKNSAPFPSMIVVFQKSNWYRNCS
ncbi:MAG: DNA N-6-adenine-methyltransferase [Sphaerospermopsis sp.]|nr:DNA N-6-adenine-methyltransferase [Sphaerospermopsis sp.]